MSTDHQHPAHRTSPIDPTIAVASPNFSSSSSVSDEKKDNGAFELVKEFPPLATREALDSDNTLTNHLLQLLRIRKRKAYDCLDEVATQPSVYDTEQSEYYTPRADYEVLLYPSSPT